MILAAWSCKLSTMLQRALHCLTLHAGVLELLLRLHKWPQGLPQEPQWPGLATRLVRGITAQHARDASNQSILGLEAHLRSIIAVPG